MNNLIFANISPPKSPTALFEIELRNLSKKELKEDFRELIDYMPSGRQLSKFTGARILAVGSLLKSGKKFWFIQFSVLSDEIDKFGRTGMVYSSAILSENKKELIEFFYNIPSENTQEHFPVLKFSDDDRPISQNQSQKIKKHFSDVAYFYQNWKKEIYQWELFILNEFNINKNFSAISLSFFKDEELDFQVIFDEERYQRGSRILSFIRKIPILLYLYNLIIR